MPTLPTTEAEIDAFLHAFESCTLPKSEWTHAAHIFTGACLVHTLGESAAIDRMRLCLCRFNESVGGQNTPTSGYHETVTVLWIKLLAAFHRDTAPTTRAAFAARAVEHFAPQRDLLARFYDFDLVASTEARQRWIPPTLQPLD
ncbi:MAG TPA: hypothetical protein VH250_09150 [Granulicella sp.]|jgi:hypothetical protein|nr:hypothetical protein [Granulicella sp.]